MCENDFVLSPWSGLGNRDFVVTGVPQGRDHREVTALVRKKTHALVLLAAGVAADKHNLFVGEAVGGIAHRSVDVVARQTWRGLEQVRFGRAVTQLSNQQFDRDTRTADHGPYRALRAD